MRVKICGITNYDDAKLCCDLGVDALGFIIYKSSKSHIQIDEAKKIIKKLPAFVSKIGVFVNESSQNINSISNQIKLNGIQLHGEESPKFIEEINLPVIKTFRINSAFDFSKLEKYNNCNFLLDTHSTEEYGGTGKVFNWEIIPAEIRNKIILAGGVSIVNIEHIYKNIQPAAVDLSSSVEEYPGKKDHKKLKEFFNKLNPLR